MIGTPEASASVTSDSVMPPTPELITRAPTSLGAELFDRADDGFERALHVGLDDERQILAAGGLELAHHLLERAAHAGRTCRHLVALLPHAVVGDFARAAFAVDHREAVAGIRRAGEAQHLDRRRRPCAVERRAGVGDECAHAAPLGARHDDVADVQRAALHENGRHRATAAIELGLDHGAFGRTIRIGLEIENFRLQADRLRAACRD